MMGPPTGATPSGSGLHLVAVIGWGALAGRVAHGDLPFLRSAG